MYGALTGNESFPLDVSVCESVSIISDMDQLFPSARVMLSMGEIFRTVSL